MTPGGDELRDKRLNYHTKKIFRFCALNNYLKMNTYLQHLCFTSFTDPDYKWQCSIFLCRGKQGSLCQHHDYWWRGGTGRHGIRQHDIFVVVIALMESQGMLTFIIWTYAYSTKQCVPYVSYQKRTFKSYSHFPVLLQTDIIYWPLCIFVTWPSKGKTVSRHTGTPDLLDINPCVLKQLHVCIATNGTHLLEPNDAVVVR